MARIVLSKIKNPSVNLAIETVLFKHFKSEPQLFIYENSPCIVVGRNQNPWKECDIQAAKRLEVPVLRRRSGGGTVVHTSGNVNFCIQSQRNAFSRTKHLDLVVDELRSRGYPLSINQRHDIVNRDNHKVSGSSYKIEREKAYHHATMLLEADLDLVRTLLERPVSAGIVTGLGTESVPSPVANANIPSEVFFDSWIAAFSKEYGNCSIENIHESNLTPEMEAEASHLLTWEWIFGESPKFNHEISQYKFEVNKGRILRGPAHLIGKLYRAPLDIDPSILRAIDPWGAEDP